MPDFTGPRGLTFEARTLFFLASWIEAFGHGSASQMRPHVCCIGQPPASVRRLSARANAQISVHEPLLLEYGGFANKLRGLEVPVDARHRLLMDADMMVLGRLNDLTTLAAALAAAPAGKPQVPEAHWRLIYEALDMPLPTERIPSARAECGETLENVAQPYPGQEAEARSMLPYFNSGVVLARPELSLRTVWENHLRRIPGIFETRALTPAHAVTSGDQVALATALQLLRQEGASLATLPSAFNARLVHFRTGALRVRGVQLLHAAGFANFVYQRSELILAVQHYEQRWGESIAQGLASDAEASSSDLGWAHAFLWNLWERWVRPEWESGAGRT